MDILIPTAGFREKDTALAPPLAGGLGGKTVGFMDNGWPSMGKLFAHLSKDLKERHEVSAVIHERFPASSVPADVLERVVKGCDAVIVALGN